MRCGSRKSALTLKDVVLRNADASKRACGQLKLSRQGVYAISSDGTMKSFRVIRWEQILKRLDEF